MLSIVRVDSGQAGSYYSADDYYLEDGGGQWYGGLKEQMGLGNKIKEEDFQKLIEGKDPAGRFEIRSGGKDNKHTAGADLTFSAPKSVSIVALVNGDKRVIDAHNNAVNATLDYIEKNYSNVRLKEDGAVSSVHSGNLLAAKFQHVSSRELDPQLHTHCVVMNMSLNENGDMRAMDYKDIFDRKLFLGQVYRSELAAQLNDIGYKIEANSTGLFEIQGIDKDLMKEFSTRSEQIAARMEELVALYPNANQAELKSIATLETRKVKDEPNLQELKEQWKERSQGFDLNVKTDLKQAQTNLTAKEAVDRALSIATETEAVVDKSKVLNIAAKFGVGSFTIKDAEIALNENKNTIRIDDNKITTKEMVSIERSIVSSVVNGKNSMPAANEVDVMREIMSYQVKKGFELTDGQKTAINHVLKSEDRIVAIQGDAGTGKTTMMEVVKNHSDRTNQEIIGLSFTGKAAAEIEDATGIKAQTIAKLTSGQENLHGKLVIIDEASMLSLRDMKAILDKSDSDTKIVLLGDSKQLQSIGQGQIFTTLQEKNIISTVRMSEIQRQQDKNYLAATTALSNKQIDYAMNKLDDRIHESKDHGSRISAITDKYLTSPKDTIVVTASNKDKDAINQQIRNRLIQTQRVSDNSLTYDTKSSKNLGTTEKHFASSFRVGDIVVSNNKVVTGKAGSEGIVGEVNTKQNTITLYTPDNKKHVVDLKHHGSHLQVYNHEKKEFAVGDKIIFLKNDAGIGVKNGQTANIIAIDDKTKKMTVKTEKGELTFNPTTQYSYISHGYAITDYKSQGQTAKHVLYHADTDKGINFNQAYVAITRGKQSVDIYTNDKAEFRKQVYSEQRKTSTLDQQVPIREKMDTVIAKFKRDEPEQKHHEQSGKYQEQPQRANEPEKATDRQRER